MDADLCGSVNTVIVRDDDDDDADNDHNEGSDVVTTAPVPVVAAPVREERGGAEPPPPPPPDEDEDEDDKGDDGGGEFRDKDDQDEDEDDDNDDDVGGTIEEGGGRGGARSLPSDLLLARSDEDIDVDDRDVDHRCAAIDDDGRWSLRLSTPPNNPLFSPSIDDHHGHSSACKSGLHGLGLKYATDGIVALSKAGGRRANLLSEISTLLDEVADSLSRLRSSSSTSSLTGGLVRGVDVHVLSLVVLFRELGGHVRDGLASPYRESCDATASTAIAERSSYVMGKARCVRARSGAIDAWGRYLDRVAALEGAMRSLARAVRIARRRGAIGDAILRRKKSQLSSSHSYAANEEEGVTSGTGERPSTPLTTDVAAAPSSSSPPPWEDDLRRLAHKYRLPKLVCESVIRAHDDVVTARENYASGVATENEAVEEAQALERMALDCLQRLEEERITFLIGLTDRFLQNEKESFEKMSVDLTQEAREPLDYLNLVDGNVNSNQNKELLPILSSLTSSSSSSQPTSSPTPASLFLTSRRRAQSDDGPAINDTRLLELPDKMAEIRERMRSLVGRQMNRLKTLKLVASFNDDMAAAIEGFALGLKSRLEIGPSFPGDRAKLGKDEAASVLSSWNAAVGSLEMLANNAEVLARRIRRGNLDLQSTISGSAEREAKSFQDREDYRWKALCDAARVETKARAKLKQHVAELEKAKARLTSTEEGDNNGAGNNTTPRRSAQSTKMDRHMNKAMGKMFSILPGGGEDVMNKVLTPLQRQAIVTRQLDEARMKEGKGTESYEIARTMKQQAVVSYEAEAEGAEFKFKCEERNDLDLIQKSLMLTVVAMRNFREGHLSSVVSLIAAKGDIEEKGTLLDDVTEWVAFVEKRVRDHRARAVDDTKVDEPDGQPEHGFSLKVQNAACIDVQDTIRQYLDDNVAMDEIDICGEDAAGAESQTAEVNGVIIDTAARLPDVPVDSFIEKMDPIFSKTMKNVSIDDYYNRGWSDETPLYGPWLERKGSFDVSVGNWEHSTEGFENSWSGEKFPQRRVIRFKFKRTTHLYIGPPIAGVTQTQYLIRDGNDKCVVMTTVDIDGVPYSDVFAVEVRWAARRLQENGIAIDAGVFVRFTKASMFASKIKSGVLKETPPVHHDLFEVIKKAILSSDDGEAINELELKQPGDDTKNAYTDIGETSVATVTTPPKFEGIFHQIIAAFSSMTLSQQIVVSFVAIYFATRVIFHKNDPRADDDLAQKVHELANEIRDMKVILERILKMSERNYFELGDMGDSDEVGEEAVPLS